MMNSLPVVVSSTASDSHMWNLVFLQLLIEELGHTVVNLGVCVPDELLVEQCRRLDPALIVISSVNGHGFAHGMQLAPRVRACPVLAHTPLVLGGKLGVADARDVGRRRQLEIAGFTSVYDEAEIPAFQDFVSRLAADRAAVS